MSAFTPGPWHRRIGRTGDGQPASQHEQICNEDGRAVVMLEHDGSGEVIANVCLMADAPEMYKMLHNIMEYGALDHQIDHKKVVALLARIDGNGAEATR